jgi:hypothetical protein
VDAEQQLDRFEIQVRRDVAAIFPEAVVSVTAKGRYRLKIRIEIGQDVFIDIFYNPHNDRTDFSLIRKSRRVFGYDNLGGWHQHPVEEPDSHTLCSEPPLSLILQEMKTLLDTL